MIAKNSYIDYLKSSEYSNELSEIAKRIVREAKITPNEATIESRFDCELFAFFRAKFSKFGFEYNPIKEKTVDSIRNVLRGRADTAVASLVIEFKQPSTLNSDKQKKKALSQISSYMEALSIEDSQNYEGFVTDGVIGCFLKNINGNIQSENFYVIDGDCLDRIVQNILSVNLIALTSKNLVSEICNPPDNNGVGFELMNALFNVVKCNMHPKTEMLYNEWLQLFNLAHDDVSKQQAIIDRRNELESLFNIKFKNTEEEYKAFFSLQTAYAIIVKILAFKVVSIARYKKSLINFYDAMTLSETALRIQMSDIENGAIFIQYGITNLLEGDFFSWYTSDAQWNTEIFKALNHVFEKLSKFADRTSLTSNGKPQDFFKELYQSMIPPAVRHSLGEYYTKKWLASLVVEEALKNCPKNWTSLDPCCGSGTFLSVLINKVLNECVNLENDEILKQVTTRVKGIDLNPIAVLTARVNYFINIAKYVNSVESLEIPVYLGDSSYVPQRIIYDEIKCLKYTISTIIKPIDVLVPESMVQDGTKFSHTMSLIETYIKNLDAESVFNSLISLCNSSDLTEKVREKINELSNTFVDLERRQWNGIWARIIANFLATANMGKFDLIVGNPPWVDWKSLPSGYRERIKSLCISKNLFSGDAITGGINLNICALITNVTAQNWLSENGLIAFLMPEPLIFQQSYEGFRKLIIDDSHSLYFYKFVNWEGMGHPFNPVTQKFLTFYMSRTPVNYKEGVNVDFYKKTVKFSIDNLEEINVENTFMVKKKYLASCHSDKNFFTYVDSKEEAKTFQLLARESSYIGREGIEFYPQELIVFHLADMAGTNQCVALNNMQNKKSKYNVPQRTVLLEKEMLRPMIKGKDIIPFHVDTDSFIVPFPYDISDPKVPIKLDRLSKIAPKLASFYQDNRQLLDSQTSYNDRIIGRPDASYYALARVGAYSFAKNYVIFRDNSKWAASVICEVDTDWGGKKIPVFQNHCVSICEDTNGNFITLDEAHYICGILNSPIVSKYMLASSDSRSFPIRPRILIPKYDSTNIHHSNIMSLSKEAHLCYNDNEKINNILELIDKEYIQIIKLENYK